MPSRQPAKAVDALEAGLRHAVVVDRAHLLLVAFDDHGVDSALDALLDLRQYEGFTCLVPGSREKDAQVERNSEGHVVWGWKRDTAPIRWSLVRAGNDGFSENAWAVHPLFALAQGTM